MDDLTPKTAAAEVSPMRAGWRALRSTVRVLRHGTLDPLVTATEDEIAVAVCGWHHDRSGGHPTPCSAARREAAAVFTFLTGRLRDAKSG